MVLPCDNGDSWEILLDEPIRLEVGTIFARIDSLAVRWVFPGQFPLRFLLPRRALFPPAPSCCPDQCPPTRGSTSSTRSHHTDAHPSAPGVAATQQSKARLRRDLLEFAWRA